MKYISICSGIEAASVAWHGLGWQPLAFSEIDPFPSAVLAQRWPDVPNLGDMSRYREWPEELLAACELLVGGTPCQAFSVAGLRKSLDDERGNLSLIYVHLFHHINTIRRKHGRSPAIALWENVPGVLSTKDNAFGCFISGLLGVDDAVETQDGKWPKAGFLGSETVRVGYRILDAQYFGVAQRRRRVFLVAVPCELVSSLGERACPSEILSLRESVLGNPPMRGAKGERVTGTIAGCSNGGGANGPGRTADDADCLVWRGGDQANSEHCIDHAGTLNCDKGQQGGIVAEPYCIDRAMFNQGVNAQYEPQITSDGVAASMVARGPAEVVGTLSDGAHMGGGLTGRTPTAVAYSPSVANTLTRRMHKGINTTVDEGQTPIVTTGGAFSEAVAFKPSHFIRGKDGKPDQVTPPLSADADKGDQDTVIMGSSVGFNWQNGGGYGNVLADAPVQLQWASGGGKVENPTMQALRTSAEHSYQFIRHSMQVRRLTPTECCRLQGFPDDHCDIVFRKKPAADGPKYRAIGNSMAVPCMAWLGYRIHKATQPDSAGAAP